MIEVNPYARAAAARRAWYRDHPEAVRRLAMPVVSIGNLAVGGRGKTPLARWLARMLEETGERPAILTRGYRRRQPSDGVVVVSDGKRIRADLDRSGDEPLMLARSLAGTGVFVSADRYVAGLLAERRFGATVHVLDDGFQHLGLRRDADIVIAARADLSDPRTFPFGRLREPLESLSAADALVADEEDEEGGRVASELSRLHPGPIFALRRETGPPRLARNGTAIAAVPAGLTPGAGTRPVDGASAGSNVETGTARAFVFAGIARPERFVSDLRRAGWTVAGEMFLGDHEPVTAKDTARLEGAARESGAEIVLTTEKDFVRMLRFRPFRFELAWVPLEVRLEPEGAFRSWLAGRLDSARRRVQPSRQPK